MPLHQPGQRGSERWRSAQFPGHCRPVIGRAKQDSETWGSLRGKTEALSAQGRMECVEVVRDLSGCAEGHQHPLGLGRGVCFPRYCVPASVICLDVLNILGSWIWLEDVSNCWVWPSVWPPRELELSTQACLTWDIQLRWRHQLFLTCSDKKTNSNWLKPKKKKKKSNLVDLETVKSKDGLQVQLSSRSSRDLIRFWIISVHLFLSFSGLIPFFPYYDKMVFQKLQVCLLSSHQTQSKEDLF